MVEVKNISINKLLLDLENPRFTKEVGSQRAAINLMLEMQEEKIIRLAKDIAANGLDPSENLMVYENKEDPGFYTVAEGNRRTTALKLLMQPTLSESTRICKVFSGIKESSIQSITKISCVIFDDEKYEHWVNLKHTGDNKGVGRERWTTPEADRYKAKHGKISFQSQLYAFMLQQEDEYSEIIKNKNFVRATNLSRLFNDKKTMTRFGLTSLDGYLYSCMPYQDFVDSFKKVLEVMTEISPDKSKPDFNVKRIYLSYDREVFLNEIGINPTPTSQTTRWRLNDPDAKKILTNTKEPETDPIGDKNTKETGHTTAQTSSKNTDQVKNKINDTPFKSAISSNRNILIPHTVKLNFHGNTKCAKIFYELKNKMTHDSTPVSISVMLRVFIELSLTNLIDKKHIKYKDAPRAPGLHDKVVMCCDYLRELKILTQSQCSAICAFSKAKLSSNGTIQQYVHNQHGSPSKDIVNTEWDNFQPLIEAVWSSTAQS
ncbi:MAG: hypothetical protein ACRCXC_04130 [Legionella sp.]